MMSHIMCNEKDTEIDYKLYASYIYILDILDSQKHNFDNKTGHLIDYLCKKKLLSRSKGKLMKQLVHEKNVIQTCEDYLNYITLYSIKNGNLDMIEILKRNDLFNETIDLHYIQLQNVYLPNNYIWNFAKDYGDTKIDIIIYACKLNKMNIVKYLANVSKLYKIYDYIIKNDLHDQFSELYRSFNNRKRINDLLNDILKNKKYDFIEILLKNNFDFNEKLVELNNSYDNEIDNKKKLKYSEYYYILYTYIFMTKRNILDFLNEYIDERFIIAIIADYFM